MSDSEFLVKQLNGEYKISNERIQPLFLQAWNLKLDFKKVKIKHISRTKNTQADELANQAMDKNDRVKKLI